MVTVASMWQIMDQLGSLDLSRELTPNVQKNLETDFI